jgi:hypothetical protein
MAKEPSEVKYGQRTEELAKMIGGLSDIEYQRLAGLAGVGGSCSCPCSCPGGGAGASARATTLE